MYNPTFRGDILDTALVLTTGARVITAPADLVVSDYDTTLHIALSTPAAALLPLPAAAGLSNIPGSRRLRVIDAAGVANSYPITVSGNGALIDGKPTAVINGAYGGIEFEWMGTYWHATGTGFTLTEPVLFGFFGMDAPPSPAVADDDEFNGSALSSAWSVTTSTLVPAAPARGQSFAGPAQVRMSQTLRTGWLMAQPSADNTPALLTKPLATAMTQGLIYMKFSMDSNEQIPATDSIALLLSQSSGGDVDFDNFIRVLLARDTSDNTWRILAAVTVATVTTIVYQKSLDSFVQPFTRMGISRDGTTFRFWVFSESGGAKHLGSFVTGALNPDRIAVLFNNSVDPAAIYGVDYIRRVNGAYPTE